MISLLITLITLATVSAMFFYNKKKNTSTRYHKNITNYFSTKMIVILLTGIVLAIFQPYNIKLVEAGFKGLKVNLLGTSRGVSQYHYKTGWVIYNNYTEQLVKFPLYQQHIEYDEQIVITKGGFSATIKPSFNYSLIENNIGDMYINLRLSTGEIEQGWLKNAIVSSVNDVANKWEVDAIFNDREKFENAIIVECNKRVSQWFIISQLRTNIIPPQSLQESIENKTKAVQEAQAAMQRKIVADAKAQEKIAIAKGDSAQMVINAQAVSLSMKIKQKELTPLYVEYIKATNWDGQLPNTVAGNGNNMLFNLK